MGYACPVCAEPQADGEHLANHLAFSAMLGRADHADWLDEHAPDWNEDGPEELAERVAPHAREVELPEVTDDAELPDPPAGARGGTAGGPGHLEDAIARGGGPGRERLDPEAREVIAEARELTRQRHGAGEGDGGDADGADEADADGADEGDAGGEAAVGDDEPGDEKR